MKLIKVFLLLTLVATISSCGRNATQGNGQSTAFYSYFTNCIDSACSDENVLTAQFFNTGNTPIMNVNNIGISNFMYQADQTFFKILIDTNKTFRIVKNGQTAVGWNQIEYFRSTWRIQGTQFIIDNFGYSVVNTLDPSGQSILVETDREIRLVGQTAHDVTTIPQGSRLLIRHTQGF